MALNLDGSSFTWQVPSRLDPAVNFQLAIEMPGTANTPLGAAGLSPAPIIQGSFASARAYARELVFEFQTLERKSNAWRTQLLDPTSNTDVDSISETVDSVLEAATNFGPSHVDLASLDLSYANAEHLVAVLRATFVWREQIPGWKAALAAAPDTLRRFGLDPAAVLQGLDE